jgi:hypothetical protein
MKLIRLRGKKGEVNDLYEGIADLRTALADAERRICELEQPVYTIEVIKLARGFGIPDPSDIYDYDRLPMFDRPWMVNDLDAETAIERAKEILKKRRAIKFRVTVEYPPDS